MSLVPQQLNNLSWFGSFVMASLRLPRQRVFCSQVKRWAGWVVGCYNHVYFIFLQSLGPPYWVDFPLWCFPFLFSFFVILVNKCMYSFLLNTPKIQEKYTFSFFSSLHFFFLPSFPFFQSTTWHAEQGFLFLSL